ncbi:MAG TPA: pentapeptide repeat-containing protein, partial [Pseudonocardiaceae bacterium]|nr:pentapeptide repeat-containing protein [Pseudonocardiaceae bacterium]
MRQLHELLWYLVEALSLQPAGSIHGELGVALDETECLTHRGPDSIMEVDVAAHRRDVNALLLRTSELVRGEARRHQIDRRGADLIGADFRGADLRSADLSDSIFLTRSQLGGAGGDAVTKLPPWLTRPTH